MAVTQEYINSMATEGYYVAQGLAVKGDIVAVKLEFPFGRISAMRLNSQDAADVFNHDIDSVDWVVFRKSEN